MAPVRYPSLYQMNTRVWLTELSRGLGRRATLDDIPDTALDEWAALGFDWIWMLSVWQTGPAGRQVSRSNHEWRKEFEETLRKEGAASRMEDWLYEKPKEGEVRPMTDFVGM